MDSVLKVVFLLDNNKSVTINVDDPKQNLTLQDVESGFGDYVVNDNMLNVGGAQTIGLKEAYYYNKEKTILE